MYDLIILGAGPAGFSAAIYASRYKMHVVVLGTHLGGRLNETHLIENYPGFPSISGYELGQTLKQHTAGFGVPIHEETVRKIEKKDSIFTVSTDKSTYQAPFVLFAIGAEYRKLQIPGEQAFRGKGVSYCATCDAPFFRNKRVAVVGGGNSAVGAALLLSEYASEVLLLYRGATLKADPAALEKANAHPNVHIACCTNVTAIRGDRVVQHIELDHPFQGETHLSVDGIFIEIGSQPNVEMVVPLGVHVNDAHFIITNPDQSTNVPGLYAAGDVTTNSAGFRQIITAASEGAIAAWAIYDQLKKKR